MVCLDTDFLVAYLRKDASAARKLKELDAKDETLHTTTINAFELYKGVFRTNNTVEELARADRLLDAFFLLIPDRDSAKVAGALHAKIKSSPIGESDLLIASIAITNKQTLLTRNVKHFERVPDLKLESW